MTEGRMIYLDEQFSQAVLICHFLFPNEAILRVFDEKIGLKGIQQFRIIIRRSHRLKIADERRESMSEEDKKDELKATVELTSQLSGQLGVLEKLIKCSTTYHEDYSPYADGEGYDLYLDYWVN